MSATGGVLLDFRDVHTYYGSLHVLKGVSYEIREGEIVSRSEEHTSELQSHA